MSLTSFSHETISADQLQLAHPSRSEITKKYPGRDARTYIEYVAVYRHHPEEPGSHCVDDDIKQFVLR